MFKQLFGGMAFPGKLQSLKTVEIVWIRDLDPFSPRFKEDAAGARCIRVGNAASREIIDLFARLPDGEQARCHIPTYGFRFLRGEKCVRWVSVCWECNNMHGDWNGKSLSYEFDGAAAVSRELLKRVQLLMDDPRTDRGGEDFPS